MTGIGRFRGHLGWNATRAPAAQHATHRQPRAGTWRVAAISPLCPPLQINVQRHRGLPLFIYRYMRRYRGW